MSGVEIVLVVIVSIACVVGLVLAWRAIDQMSGKQSMGTLLLMFGMAVAGMLLHSLLSGDEHSLLDNDLRYAAHDAVVTSLDLESENGDFCVVLQGNKDVSCARVSDILNRGQSQLGTPPFIREGDVGNDFIGERVDITRVTIAGREGIIVVPVSTIAQDSP